MATGTTATLTTRKPNAGAKHHVRFLVVFLVMALTTMRFLPIYVSMPVALGAGLVADEPSFKRLLLAVVAGIIVAGIYLWQRS